MNWPGNDSPFWTIAGVAVMGIVGALMMQVMYQNGFDPKADLPTLLTIVGSGGAISALRLGVNRKQKGDDK